MYSNTQSHYNPTQNQQQFYQKKPTRLEQDPHKTACLLYTPKHQEQYGLDCALLIQHMAFWIRKNIEQGINRHDGKTWMYQTQEQIACHYPEWTRAKVQRIINKLVYYGVLIKGNFNKTRYDRTSWYAFVDEEKFLHVSPRTMEGSLCNNGSSRFDPPIPDKKNNILKTYKKNNIAETPSFSCGNQNIVFSLPFNPKTYVMRNGFKFSPATVKLFEKYSSTKEGGEKLKRNIRYYQDYCDRGGKPKNHEAYIQACFKNDYAKKEDTVLHNHLFAEMYKAENQIHNMKVLKTVVQFYKDGEIQPISISKDLPYDSFCATIENFKRYHCP